VIHHRDEGLVSPSDIADIAGISRGAVSNWRKRADDFPEPVAGTQAKPLFSRQAVNIWLESRGYELRKDAGETGVWAALNLLRDQLSPEDAAGLVMSLAVSRRRGEEAVLDVPSLAPDVVRRVSDAIDSVDIEDLGAAVDFALVRLGRSQGKVGAELGFVGSRTTTLLATLAAARPSGVLYDPACGIAAALLETMSLGARPERAVGHDVSERALRLASHRAELAGIDLELIQTDVLAEDVDPDLRADTVILDPPIGVGLDSPARLTDARFVYGPPPRMSADTAWLQHAIAHLSPSGRAYVLTPQGVLSRGGEEGRIRTELVRRGCVEAVVGLPGKMLTQTSIPLALWVLRRPRTSKALGGVLLIDASESESPEDQVVTWLSDPESLAQVPHVHVPDNDLLAAGSALAPQRWVDRQEPAPDQVNVAYTEGWSAINGAVQKVNDTLAFFEHSASFSHSRAITVGELIEQGVLELRLGRSKDRYADAPQALLARFVEARDIRDGTLRNDDVEGEHPGYPELTLEDDVLVTTMNEIRAQVDEVGGHIPSTGVYRLRVLDKNVVLPHYLALALTGGWNQRFQGGSHIQRAPIRELEVPLLPVHDQISIWGAALSIDWLRREARQLEAAAAQVLTALMDAVRYNAPLTEPTILVSGTGQNGPHANEGAK
jgi:hypothetical protein